jgi:hypothetical protein
LGFIGEGCIARSERHEFNQFEFANIEASLILKSTRFKAAPLQLPISELCTAAAVKFGELRPLGPAAEHGLATAF